MIVKSLSPSSRTNSKVSSLEKSKFRILNHSGASHNSSRSPQQKHLHTLNQSSETPRPPLFPAIPKIQTAVLHLQNKLRASRSYHLIAQPPSPTSQSPTTLHLTHLTNLTHTPTAHLLNPSAFKVTPSNRQQQPHISFHTRKRNEYDINNRISNLKQGIDKCLKQLEMRRFQVIRRLGSGINGEVVLARIRNLAFVVALKTVKKSQAQTHSKCLIEEIKIQAFLDHPNIIKLYGLTSDQDNIYLILEVSSHNLFRQIRQQRGFSQQKTKNYIKQVLNALAYLHSFNIIHRDVKPENILCCHGVLKLCDFGWSVHNCQNSMRKTFCGTYDYVSPQVSQGCLYDYQIDAWSAGILTYEMLTCTVPFKQKLIVEHEEIYFPARLSRAVKDFISRLLVYDARRRMTVQEALQHGWLVGEEEGGKGIGRGGFQEIQLLNLDEE